MKYIATDLVAGVVAPCTQEEAEEFRHHDTYFVVRIDYSNATSHWLNFEDEVPLND